MSWNFGTGKVGQLVREASPAGLTKSDCIIVISTWKGQLRAEGGQSGNHYCRISPYRRSNALYVFTDYSKTGLHGSRVDEVQLRTSYRQSRKRHPVFN